MDKHRSGQSVPTKWMNAAIIAFEEAYDRELNLDEKVAICANSRQAVRAHFAEETGETASF